MIAAAVESGSTLSGRLSHTPVPISIPKMQTGVEEVWENEKSAAHRVILETSPNPTNFYPCTEELCRVEKMLAEVEADEDQRPSDDTASVSDASTQTEWATGWETLPNDVISPRHRHDVLENEEIKVKNTDYKAQHIGQVVLTDFWDVLNCNIQPVDSRHSANLLGVQKRIRKKRNVRSMTAMDPEVLDLKRELARVTLNCDYFVQHFLQDKTNEAGKLNPTSDNFSPSANPLPSRSVASLTTSEGCVCCFGSVSKKAQPSRIPDKAPVSSSTWRESSESQFLSSSLTSRDGQSETSSSLSPPNQMCARCGSRFVQEVPKTGVESSPSPRRRHYSQGSSFRRAVRKQILKERALQIEKERSELTTDDDLYSPEDPVPRQRRGSLDVPAVHRPGRSQYLSLSHFLVEQAECGQTQLTRDVLHITAV